MTRNKKPVTSNLKLYQKIPIVKLYSARGIFGFLFFAVQVNKVSKFLILPVSFEKKPSEKSD